MLVLGSSLSNVIHVLAHACEQFKIRFMALRLILMMSIKVAFDMVGMGSLNFLRSMMEIQDKEISCFNNTLAN